MVSEVEEKKQHAKGSTSLTKKKRKERTAIKTSAAVEGKESAHYADSAEQGPAKSNAAALTVFVGQLPYSATADSLQKHFATSGVQGKVIVRLLTNKDTGKSRGMAFAQLASEADVHTALKLHKTLLSGRRINVERTVGGGGKNDKRMDKIKKLRSSQDSSRMKAMGKIVSRLVVELAPDATKESGEDSGKVSRTLGLQREDADERVLALLTTVPEEVAVAGLKDFAGLPATRNIWNRAALLTSRLRKFFQDYEAKQKRQQEDALEKFTVQSNDEPPHLEMASGAIVCKRSAKEEVMAAVPPAWKRQHVKGLMPAHSLTDYEASDVGSDEAMVALHLTAEGAACLKNGLGSQADNRYASKVPKDLLQVLESGTGRFRYGLRAGSAECRGPHREELMPTRAESSKTQSSFRYIELFAGIGGFRIGLDAVGGHCAFASELDSHARKTYAANFEEMPAGDITEIEAQDVPEHDILTAGFPCQPFSIAGDQEGTSDPKGVLFLEVTRILYARRPAAFILENVPQVKELDAGRVMDTILAELRGAGYVVIHRVLNARAVVPQRRARLYWLGFDVRCGGEAASKAFKWPAWADDADRDSTEFHKTKSYSTADGALPTELACAWKSVGEILEPAEEIWEAHELTPVKLASVERQDKYWNHSLDYHFVNEKGAAKTLIGSYLKFGRSDQLVAPPKGDKERRPRLFTPRECCRLMGFPDSYKPLGEKRIYHEFGNAVCPPVVSAIAKSILATGIIAEVGASSGTSIQKKTKHRKATSVESNRVLNSKGSSGKKRKRKVEATFAASTTQELDASENQSAPSRSRQKSMSSAANSAGSDVAPKKPRKKLAKRKQARAEGGLEATSDASTAPVTKRRRGS